ncbi:MULTISPECIES: sensor histidine kinase [unclassified Polaribacter]|uniref:sensor histidine kinase n=1 Tax=unclassified Polaribacter TaxID=196858 RepID=UPI0016778E52|nr:MULTISPECIES: sensor histidine kinase [unclassified Polaribacter]
MKTPCTIFFFLITLTSYSQSAKKIDKYIQKVENFIIYNQPDSASFYLKKLQDNSYTAVLSRIIKNKEVTYAEYEEFTSKLADYQIIDYEFISNYINRAVKKPIDSKNINLEYVYLKWVQISDLRDEATLEAASSEQSKLEDYIDKFDKTDKDVLKAETRIKTHPIVMFLIEKDLENAKELVLKSLKISEDLEEIELQIYFLYHYAEVLVLERKLDEFIKTNERCLLLEEKLPKRSAYYYFIVANLINAYIYKGGNNERAVILLDELYNSSSKNITYIYYAQLISNLDKNAILKKEILDKFQAQDVSDLASKFIKLGNRLNPNDSFKLVNMNSKALAAHGFYTEAIAYKEKAIEIIRKIYSEDLSKSLAKYKTEQALKVKETEISREKEKTKLYSIIASLFFVLLLITLLVLVKIRNQSKELSSKNQLINDALIEKELLITEVHHRVKNNFQIISSLLELQSEGIEDKKALELINQSQDRVKSMALIHQKLYRNESGLIDFNEYTSLLIKEISFVYQLNVKVDTTIKIENVFFDVDTAIPLGLIINEIITNAYKYAFKNDKENVLFISIHQEEDKDYKLVIEDNGLGISNSFQIEEAKSTGLKLVKRLVRQLQGSLELLIKHGTRFEIIFKDSNKRKCRE